MKLNATMTGIIQYLKENYSDEKFKDDNEFGLLAYLLVKKQYGLNNEYETLENDKDALWFLEEDQGALSATANYRYSIDIEDFYIDVLKRFVIYLVSKNGALDKSDIPALGITVLDALKNVIYKLKKDERCIYHYICVNDKVSEKDIYSYFGSKCNQKNKNISLDCPFFENNSCNLHKKEDIKDKLENLLKNKVIKISKPDDKDVFYTCVF